MSGCTVLYEMRIGDVWRQNSNGGGGVACLLWAEAELLGRVGMAHSIDGRRAAVPRRWRVNQVAIDGLIIPSLRGRPPIPGSLVSARLADCVASPLPLIPWLLLFPPAGRPVAGAKGPKAHRGGRHHFGVSEGAGSPGSRHGNRCDTRANSKQHPHADGVCWDQQHYSRAAQGRTRFRGSRRGLRWDSSTPWNDSPRLVCWAHGTARHGSMRQVGSGRDSRRPTVLAQRTAPRHLCVCRMAHGKTSPTTADAWSSSGPLCRLSLPVPAHGGGQRLDLARQTAAAATGGKEMLRERLLCCRPSFVNASQPTSWIVVNSIERSCFMRVSCT